MEKSPAINELLALNLTTDELRLDLARELRLLESTRSTARGILAAGSLIIALVATFQIAIPTTKIPEELYARLFYLALGLYAMMIVSCVAALWPVRLANPAQPGREDLYSCLEGRNEVEARRVLYQAYRHAFDENQTPVRRVRLWTAIGTLLLPVVVVVLLFLSFNVP